MQTETQAQETTQYPTRYAAGDSPGRWVYWRKPADGEAGYTPGTVMEAAVFSDTHPHHKYPNLSDGVHAQIVRHQGWKNFMVDIQAAPYSHGTRSLSEQENRIKRCATIQECFSFITENLPAIYAAIREPMPPGALNLPPIAAIAAQHAGRHPITGEAL